MQILKISSLKMVISRNINRDDLNLPSLVFGKLNQIHDNQKIYSNIIFKEMLYTGVYLYVNVEETKFPIGSIEWR